MLDARTYAFAEPIKEAVKVIFGWGDEHVHGDLKDVVDQHYGVSPRQAMQTLGTEWGRNLNEQLWLLRADVELQDAVAMDTPLVVTDVRFENEAEWIRNNGGSVIHLSREQATGVRKHVSEDGIFVGEKDYVFANNGSMRELRTAMARIVTDIYERPFAA
jgi:hypothetical protein